MKLAIFDLDGTLAGTSVVDEICFVQAFSEALNIHHLSTNWLDYDHATDTAVARQAFLKQFGREPDSAEVLKVVQHFVELLKRNHADNATLFSEVAGASAFLDRLQTTPEWGVALATGGWKRSAEFKIKTTGLPLSDMPAAFAEDGPSREAIIQAAIARASAWYRRQEFERIVSVGDALWDVNAARNLALPFLGIAAEPRASLLRDNGAGHVIEHFLDQGRCLQLLDEVVVPKWRVG